MRKTLYHESDRKAIMALLIMALAGLSVVYYSGTDGSTELSRTDIADTLNDTEDTLMFQKRTFHRKTQPYYHVKEHASKLFPFDPNTVDSTSLFRLGLQPWQVRNIYKYRARGGVYRRPADFARLYGLTVGQYRRLEPYIRISPDFLPASSLPEAGHSVRDTIWYPAKITPDERIVLNTADTAMLRRVPGIGPVFASMIVAYGERLGGYVSVEQLDEIDDFPQETKQYFVISNPETRRMNLNKLKVLQMCRHPYITFHQAKAIEDYRRLYGPLHSLQDLHLHRDFTPDAISRLEPYVEF